MVATAPGTVECVKRSPFPPLTVAENQPPFAARSLICAAVRQIMQRAACIHVREAGVRPLTLRA